MSRFRGAYLVGSLSLWLVLLGVEPLHAQSDTERAGARAAAGSGLEAYNAGRFAESIDLFKRAESLVHAPTHLLYIARGHEKLGHLVEARELYVKLTREQLIAGAPRAFLDAQETAQTELQAIEARLPYLTVTLEGSTTDGVRVSLDDREIPSVLLGVPFPANPGEHQLVARGNGMGCDPVKVTLAEGKRERTTLTLTPRADALTPAPGATLGPVAPKVATTPSEPKDSSPSATASPLPAYAALGVGAVGLGVGTVFLLQRGSKQKDADQLFADCKTRVCSSQDTDQISSLDKSASSAGTLSLVGYGVGAAGLATGLYLLLGTSPTPPSKSAYVRPIFGLGQVGAEGRF